MAKGTTYNHERIEFVDARTGVRLMQVTSFPTMSMALPYFGRNFTGDSKTFIFVSQREARRDAPWDLFRVDTDGTNLTQLTECEGAAGFVMSPQDDCVYFHRQATLWRVDIHTFREEEIAVPHGVASMGAGAISPDGVYYFAQVTTAHDTGGILRIRTDGSEATLIAEGERGGFAMHSVSPGGEGILLWQMREGKKTWLLLDYDGKTATCGVCIPAATTSHIARCWEVQSACRDAPFRQTVRWCKSGWAKKSQSPSRRECISGTPPPRWTASGLFPIPTGPMRACSWCMCPPGAIARCATRAALRGIRSGRIRTRSSAPMGAWCCSTRTGRVSVRFIWRSFPTTCASACAPVNSVCRRGACGNLALGRMGVPDDSGSKPWGLPSA